MPLNISNTKRYGYNTLQQSKPKNQWEQITSNQKNKWGMNSMNDLPQSNVLSGQNPNLSIRGYAPLQTNQPVDRSKLTIGSNQDAVKQEFGMPNASAYKDAMSRYKVDPDKGLVSTSTPTITRSGGSSSPSGSSQTSSSGGGSTRGLLPTPTSNNNNPASSTGTQSGTGTPSTSTGTQTGGRTRVNADGTREPSGTQFSQFTGGLLGRGTDTTADQQRYLDMVEEAARRGETIGNRAADISDMYGNEIARVGRLGAGAVAGNLSTGTQVVGRGNANLAAESASNRISALSAAQAAALQGTQQQLTGAEQGLTGANYGLTGANTQQQLAQNALQAGGQLAAPQVAQYGQTVFDPTTGQYTGAGGSMDPAVQAQTLAQQVMSGQTTYDQAVAALGYAPGGVGTNFLNNAITQAGGNPLQLQAQSAGQQANISTQTTAGTEIGRSGYEQSLANLVDMSTQAQAAEQQAMAVSDILAQAGLNDVNSRFYNRRLNDIKREFGDNNFQNLETALIEAQAMYSTLLQSAGGGTPSSRTQQALDTLSTDMSAEQINASIQELENAVARRLQAQQGAVDLYQQNLQQGQTTGGTQTGGGDAGSYAETWL